MLLSEMFDNYYLYSEVYNTKGTLIFYKEVYHCLIKYFGNIDSSKITKKEIFYYIKESQKTLSNSTINKRIGFLKAMYRYNEIDSDFLKIKKLKEDYKTYGYLDKDTLQKLMKEIFPNLTLHNKVIIKLLLDTGVRANELVNIKIKNIDLENRTIFLEKTKSGKVRNVYFTPTTKQLLIKYIKNNHHEYLFYNKETNTHIKASSLETIFRRIKIKYDLKKFSPHMLRHTLSTNVYTNGGDYYFIMNLLGHTDMNITKRYVHEEEEEKRKRYDKYRVKIKRVSS